MFPKDYFFLKLFMKIDLEGVAAAAAWKPGDERGNMSTMHPTRGFSLIELMIAMALVAIVSALGIPQFQKYAANENLKTAAREVTGDFFTARQRAVAENLDAYDLTFDVSGNRYSLTRSDTGTTLWTKSLASFGTGTRLQSANFSGTTVSFKKRGTVSMGNLILTNNRESTAKVTATITGRTYVEFTMR
jgi:prepilin-type N-terminal cleavage/methylation domain-containing protein